MGVSEGGFLHDLSAGSAGGDRLWGELALLVAGGNGYGFHLLVGISASGIEQCRALGAKSGGIGGIFLVAAADDGAVGQTKCCTYGKTGVGRIAAGGGADGLFDECAIGGMQLVQGVVFGVGDKKLLLFHGECGVDGRNMDASKIQRKEDLAKRCRAFSKKMQRFSEKDAEVLEISCRGNHIMGGAQIVMGFRQMIMGGSSMVIGFRPMPAEAGRRKESERREKVERVWRESRFFFGLLQPLNIEK